MRNSSQNTYMSSLIQFSKPKTLAIVGLLIACKVLLDLMTIQVANFLHISFEFLTEAIVCMLFGPVAGGLYGLTGDLISYMVYPKGAFFIGFTIVAVLSGIFNGFLLYRKKPTIQRIAVVHILNILIFNLILTTLCLSFLYQTSFFVLLPTRILKCFIMLPIEIPLLYAVLNVVHNRKLAK